MSDHQKASWSDGLPILAERSLLRYISFAALYVAQGLPFGLVLVAMPGWLAKQGLSAGEVGAFTGFVALPWAFKFTGGPLMDRFGYLPMGRRRPWVIGAQIGILISFTAMAFIPDPIANLSLLAGVAFVANLCAAFQDVAVDGMAIDLLPEDQRARANGFMFGGQAVGAAFSSIVGGTIMSTYGLGPAVYACAWMLGLIALIPILFRERSGEKYFPWTKGEASAAAISAQLHSFVDILKSLMRVFILPTSLIATALVFSYRTVEGLLWAILPVMTVQDLGWGDGEYAQVQGAAGLASGIIGMIAGATVVHRFGSKPVLVATSVAWIVINVLVASFPDQWENRTYATIYFYATNTVGMVFLVANVPLFMGICWKKVAATQFSLYMAMANLGTSFGGMITGTVNSLLDYQGVMYFVGVLGIGLIFLIGLIDTDRNAVRLAALDATTA